MRTKRYINMSAVILVIAAGVIGALLYPIVTEDKTRLDTDGSFRKVVLGDSLNLFSIGVADFNENSRLDVFTTNHFMAENFFRNLGQLNFEVMSDSLGMATDSRFRRTEVSSEPPAFKLPGLYMYWQNGEFNVVSKGLKYNEPHKILLSLIGGILPQTDGNITVKAHEQHKGETFPTKLTLELKGDGSATLLSLQWAVNGMVELDKNFDLDKVFVGHGQSSAFSYRFGLSPGDDRHAIAWTDLDGDGRKEAIVTGGGEVGAMPEHQHYPVYSGAEMGTGNQLVVPGLIQEFCPSRQVSLVDVNSDGWNDLHVVCGRGGPPRQYHPDEVFIRTSPSNFQNKAKSLGLDLPGAGVSRWFDLEGDSSPELLWVTSEEIVVLAKGQQGYERVFSADHQSHKDQIAIGDITNDGYPDFYIGSLEGPSALLKTSAEGYALTTPESSGLPLKAGCASFVDYDNDGIDDFYSLPDGLLRGSKNGGFEPTGLLSGGPYNAYCLWFDADNNGYRDLLVALPKSENFFQRVRNKILKLYEERVYRDKFRGRVYRPQHWNLAIYENRAAENSWLQVELKGPDGNPDGLSARVTVTAGERTQIQDAGHAEGSTSSHGHFRLYFGLGDAVAVDSLQIEWPNGTVQRVKSPPINNLLRITYAGVANPAPVYSQSSAEP